MAVRLLITRPAPDAEHLAALCRAQGIEPVLAPLITITARPATPLPVHDGIIVTSPHALQPAVACQLSSTTAAYVVGARAEALLVAQGITVRHRAESAHALLDHLTQNVPSGRLLYLSGSDVALDIVVALSARGIACERVMTYDAPALAALPAHALSLLASDTPPWLFCSSKRMLALLGERIAPHVPLASLHALCLSRAIADEAARHGFARVLYPATPSLHEAVALIAPHGLYPSPNHGISAL